MKVDQLDHSYEIKIDLGDYQTGTAEFYVLAGIDGDVTAARAALQDMATRNLRFAGAKLQDKAAPKDNSLGLDAPGLTVTKIGVGYGKKINIGKGVGKRSIEHRIWGQLLPGDNPAESAAQLWQFVFDAYDEKMAQMLVRPTTPAKKAAQPNPETKPVEANPPQDAPLADPGAIREMALALANRYRGQAEPSGKQRYPAMHALNGAVGEAYPGDGVVRDTFTGWILAYLFGNESDGPMTEFELEAKHLSALIRWSNRDGFKVEVKALADYLDRAHNLTNPTEIAF